MAENVVFSFQVTDKVTRPLNKMIKAATEAKAAINGLTDSINGIKPPIEKASSTIEKHTSILGKLGKSVARIGFYRAIRSAMKMVTQAAKEGINNLVQYSIALNNLDSSRATGTMNEFATTALYAKNSLGAALMPILQSLLPIVNAIADAFVWAANAVNQFWHAMKGETVFTKATRYAVEYGDALGGAAGKAKELKKQVFGFDELNIFDAPSNGGGGGGAPALDYSKMFEEADVSGLLLKIKTALDKGLKDIVETMKKNLGQDFFVRLKANVSDIIFNWSDLNSEQIGMKLETGFLGALGMITGFLIAGKLGAFVGSILGLSLGVYISTITFNGDGVISQDEVLTMVKDAAAVLTGAVVGWSLGGVKGAFIGASVAVGLIASIKSFVPEAGMAFAGLEFAGLLLAVIKTIAESQKLKFMTGAVGAGMTAQFGIIAATALTLNIISLLSNAGFKETRQTFGVAIAEAINVIAAAAILGCVFGGGIAGALVAITIAAALNVLINSVNWNLTAQSARELEKGANTVDLASMNAYMKFGIPDSSTGNPAKDRARGRASGGFVPTGTYFYAGESMPELVGVVGGRTHVTNESQFTAGMGQIMDVTNSVIMQAANALIQAIQNMPTPSLRIGDRDIVNMYDRGKTLAGASLVE